MSAGEGEGRRPAASRALYARIYALVREIPPGRVATYGQLARMVGCAPRVVGYAMAALPAGSGVPWQRVVNGRGGISPRTGGGGEIRQRRLLEAEGLSFDPRGRLDLAEVAWPGPGLAWLERHGYEPAGG